MTKNGWSDRCAMTYATDYQNGCEPALSLELPSEGGGAVPYYLQSDANGCMQPYSPVYMFAKRDRGVGFRRRHLRDGRADISGSSVYITLTAAPQVRRSRIRRHLRDGRADSGQLRNGLAVLSRYALQGLYAGESQVQNPHLADLCRYSSPARLFLG